MEIFCLDKIVNIFFNFTLRKETKIKLTLNELDT